MSDELVIWELTDRWDDGTYRRCIVTPERAKALDAIAETAGLGSCTHKADDDKRAEAWMIEMTPMPAAWHDLPGPYQDEAPRKQRRGERRARTDSGRLEDAPERTKRIT